MAVSLGGGGQTSYWYWKDRESQPKPEPEPGGGYSVEPTEGPFGTQWAITVPPGEPMGNFMTYQHQGEDEQYWDLVGGEGNQIFGTSFGEPNTVTTFRLYDASSGGWQEGAVMLFTFEFTNTPTVPQEGREAALR